MIRNYLKDPKLFEKSIYLIDQVFPGCKELALKSMKYGASWQKASIPFIIEEKGKIIAHLGILPIEIEVNKQKYNTAAIHGICVKEERRGEGCFKHLMLEAMDFINKNFNTSILFTDKPYLYRNYPYKIMLPEYNFLFNKEICSVLHGKKLDLRTLCLDNSNDLKLLYNIFSTRMQMSEQISVLGENSITLFIMNTLCNKLHYSKELNALIIFDIVDNTLYIKEIVSPNNCDFTSIINSIPNAFEKIVFQFCPDQFLEKEDYTAILANPEYCVMASNKFDFQGEYFCYPRLYSC